MYSVEDLLISHGYKLPKACPTSSSSSTSVAAATSTTPYDKRYTDCHRVIVENRPGRGTLNGYEVDRGACCVYGSRQALALAKGYPADSESQRRKEAGGGNLGDAQPLGDSLATDSGFYDAPSLTYSEQLLSHDERDVSYWRRRGQDFSVLLDYADGRELRASAGSWRPQALIAAEEHRERQQQLWEDLSWLRDPDCAPGQLRVTGERKCQSLGTEEWKPAVGLGRQLSDGEGERWAQEQHRLRATEGAALPRTKGKSQSLPRVLSPDGTEHTDVVPSRPGQLDRQRVNSTVFSGPYSRYYYSAAVGRDRWGRGWPSGHVALLPKPRFSRPVKPPSYEIHQQTRGSSEMIAADQGSKQKDRPIYYYPRGGELQRQDYFAQHSTIFGMEPPGYIPPPSYRRAPIPRGGPINRNELTNYKWRGELLQVPVNSEAARWFSRQTGGSWLEHYGDRGVAYRKQVHPGYTEEHPGHVRYLPFDDPPRVRQISGGPGGNSLTDSDKIRNINKEIPCAKVLGQSSHDSAFPPPQGLSLNTDGRKTSLNDNDSSNRWCNRGMNKGSDIVASEQSCANYPTAFQVRPPPPPPPQSKPVDQGVAETVTQVKKNDPEPEKEKPKSIKKKLNETIFCLVSVPTPLMASGTSRDQNNNDEKPPDPVESPSENKTGHLTNQSLQSTSSAEAELQALTGSITSSITSSRASSKVVKRVPCRPPKINHYKELKLSGSWPANQYRDQETQTSPEARKPAPPGPENKEAQEPVPSGSDVAPDSGVGSTAFSYPIKGVKSLKPSSNSAFSRTSTFSSQLNKSTAQTSAPPSGNVEEAKPAAAAGNGGGQEAFGQFLLKPVSRRPWDAIEELETINKELQNQQSSKGPSVDQCIEDLNEAYKDILELGTASNKVPNDSVQIPERIKIRLTGEPLNKPSSLRRSMESWSVSVDPDYREVKSAFSRPAAKSVTFSKQLREELPVPPRETGFREYRVIPNLTHRRNSDGRTVKLDLPDEPIEMPLCDFSPTMHTTAAEVPWADRQPMQDASTLTSPPDYEDICQTLRQSRDSSEANTAKSKSGTSDAQPLQNSRVDSEEECPICKRESESQMRQIPMPPLHEEDCLELTNQNSMIDDNTAAQSSENVEGGDAQESTDPGSNQSELDLCPDRGEQPPLTDEDVGGAKKANSTPARILDSLIEATSVEGIPENESIEERAARILGIDVPAASLVTAEQSVSRPATEETESTESKPATGDVPESSIDKPTSHMKEDSRSTGSADRQDREKKHQAILEPRSVLRTHLGRDHPGIPEFPPDRLPLSVPLNPDRRLSLSMEGERRSRGPSQRIEALQDKLVTSPRRVAIERLARMKEVDSVSRMRRLSFRSTDSGEGEGEEESKSGPEEEPPPTQRVDDREVTHTPPVSIETVLQDEDEAPALSEAYDPSHVERV